MFSVYAFATLLQKAVRQKGAEHPRRDFIEFAEVALHKMAEKNIVELLLLENGYLAACIKWSGPRTLQIAEGKLRYQKVRLKRETERRSNIRLLKRCFENASSD